MISVLPVPEEERQDFCASHPVCRDYSCLYRAAEAGVELGWFSVREEENRLVIPQLQLKNGAAGEQMGEEDKLIAELMIRSAASYALNRYLPEICCEETSVDTLLSELKFKKDALGVYMIQLKNLIHQCANCQN